MRRNRVFLAFAILVGAVHAQFFNLNMGGRSMPELKGTVRLEPSEVVVGTPCGFVFDFGRDSTVNIQQIAGLPEGRIEYLSQTIEPYADGTYRLAARFLEPCTNMTLNLVVSGMQTVEQGRGGAFHSSYSTSFRKRLPPLRLDVRPLPTVGRPASFAGAVGTKFTMTQTLEPDHVHPGDLVKATYELRYDGYCPSNAWPTIEHLSKEFKAYEAKEVERTPHSFKWTQMLVPRTTAATNSAFVSFPYYNPHVRRYEVARAPPKKLVFVSDKAASTKNTAVMIDDSAKKTDSRAEGEAEKAGNEPIVLRFAPSDASPAIATLPPGTPVKELARSNGWRRLETPRAIGWSR